MRGEIVLELERAFETAVEPTQRVCEVASMFGLGVDQTRRMQVVGRVSIPIAPGSVIFITGASGGGKSTLLRLIGEALRARGDVRVVDFGEMSDVKRRGEGDEASGHCDAPRLSVPSPGLEDSATLSRGERGAIVEAIGGTLEEAVRWLALAGLNDAFVMLRKPGELSDGQRYRFKLARAMAESERMADGGWQMADVKTSGVEPSSRGLTVVLADEFAATLDRQTAGVIARNVRKWVDRGNSKNETRNLKQMPRPLEDLGSGLGGVCFIAVSTHDDLLEHLEPDVLVVQEPGEGIVVRCRERNDE